VETPITIRHNRWSRTQDRHAGSQLGIPARGITDETGYLFKVSLSFEWLACTLFVTNGYASRSTSWRFSSFI
jgi:hypothetical protein